MPCPLVGIIPPTLKVSVIIPTRNRSAHLRRTLGHLTEIEIPPSIDLEFVIVDNGSTDDTQAAVASFLSQLPNLKWVSQPVPGASRARNLGVQIAQGEIIAFLDDDVKPCRAWLIEILRSFENPEISYVGGEITLDPSRTPDWMTPFHHGLFASTEFQTSERRASRSANCAYHRRCFAEGMGFDPEIGAGTSYGFAEEFLFNWGLKEAGMKFAFNPHASVIHEYDVSRVSLDSMIKMAKQTGASGAYAMYHFAHVVPKLLWLRSRIWSFRAKRVLTVRPSERTYLTESEFMSIQRASQLNQFLTERNRPHNYDLHSRKKIRGVLE